MAEPRTIRYFFTLQSPWAFIGHARFLDIARRHNARIDYRPVSLSEIFPNSGGLPFAKRHPSRQLHRNVDLKRWRARLKLDFHTDPAFWPLPIAQADRTVVALIDLQRDPEPFVTGAFSGIWREQLDLADAGTIARLLEACGGKPDAVMARAASSEIADLYESNTQGALASKVFGSPTYLLDGEPFWGQDRLDFLEEALATGRAPILG